MMIDGAMASVRADPFPHTSTAQLLSLDLIEAALKWMEGDAPWKLRVADFYEQWEMHLCEGIIPCALGELVCPRAVQKLADRMLAPISGEPIELTEITAHRLISGQTIRIHNDFIPDGESYRILVQLNRGWADEQGGLLMLFGGPNPDDIRRAIRPISGSAFAFEISSKSFHAVSKVLNGERFTLVYSFRKLCP